MKNTSLSNTCITLVLTGFLSFSLLIAAGCASQEERRALENDMPDKEAVAEPKRGSSSAPVDKTDLKKTVQEEEGFFNSGALKCFTDMTAQNYEAAYNQAVKIIDDDSATLDDVKKAQTDLVMAADGLKVDFDAKDYESVKWEDLARYPDKYENKTVSIEGEVFQYEEVTAEDGTDFAQVLISVDEDYEDSALLTVPVERLDGRLLEGDKVVAYGRYVGLYSYETVWGNDANVPNVIVYYVKVGDRH